MSSPQLDIVKPGEIEDTITKLMTKGLLGGMPVPVGHLPVDASVLDHGSDAAASSVKGLSSHAMSEGGTIISGPAEGGALLERPVGSYLAEQARDHSLGLEQYDGPGGVTHLAKRVAGAGEMTVGGVDVNLIDFVPGGDFVQMAAGERFNPSSMLMALAKGKMESEMIHGHLMGRETDREQAAHEAERATAPTIHEGANEGTEHGTTGRTSSPWGDGKTGALDVGEESDHAPGAGPLVGPRGRSKIDQDTAARDMAILGGEHALNLDNAVSQWDEQDVHTEMTLHGRKIEIDTHFDAHNPDNKKERDVAEGHARHIPDADNKETVTEGNRMAFRSQVHAHIEATSRDEGIAR